MCTDVGFRTAGVGVGRAAGAGAGSTVAADARNLEHVWVEGMGGVDSAML